MSADVTQDGGGRLYQKKKGRHSRPQSGVDAISTGSSNGSVRLKLNKLNDYEADDAKMVTVFGVANEETPSSMKLNPLYDKNGIIEVTPEEADQVRKATISAKNYHPKNRPRSSDYSPRSVRSSTAASGATQPEDIVIEPKIAYSKNFRFKNSHKSKQQNTNASDRNGSVKSFGRVMPSRIHKNTHNSLAGFDSTNASSSASNRNGATARKAEVEAQVVQNNIRRNCRKMILFILCLLLTALVVTILLYFTVGKNNKDGDE